MILADVQALVPGNLVTLFEVDMTALGGMVERYHNHNDGVITWQGERFLPWAIEAKEFERTGDGQQPRPTITVSNIGVDELGNKVTGVVTVLCLALEDLIGAKVIRHRTLAKYLDAVNFEEGNPTADPNEHLPIERWIISQKRLETPESVEFVLSSPLEFQGVKLPQRQIIPGLCGWLVGGGEGYGYRGAYCGYTGSAMFDENGNPVSDPTLDKCGGRVSDCKLRFGASKPLPFGGFPAAGNIG